MITVKEAREMIKDLMIENKTCSQETKKINDELILFYTKRIGEISIKVWNKHLNLIK